MNNKEAIEPVTRRKPLIRTLIVDDEPLARRRLKRLLARDPDVDVVGSAASGLEASKLTQQLSPDLIFLDVQMPRMDGFEFLRTLTLEKPPQVIFVTAHDDYALRAFEVNALDYLLKPFDDERFDRALRRAKAHHSNQTDDRYSLGIHSLLETLQAKSKRLHRLLIKTSERVFFIKTNQIDWVEAEGKYVRVHAGPQSYLLRQAISELEVQLSEQQFLRIHRSTIVNVERIKEMQRWFHGDYKVILVDGTRLRFSRRYRSRLKDFAVNSL